MTCDCGEDQAGHFHADFYLKLLTYNEYIINRTWGSVFVLVDGSLMTLTFDAIDGGQFDS